jgi:hypothetical protein
MERDAKLLFPAADVGESPLPPAFNVTIILSAVTTQLTPYHPMERTTTKAQQRKSPAQMMVALVVLFVRCQVMLLLLW